MISDQKEIRDVKVRREIWGLRVRQDRPARQDLLDHREIWGFRDPEAFRVQQEQPAQPALWVRKA